VSPKPSIPFHFPRIGEEEIEEVVATLRSGWLTTGPRAHQFEEDFRTYTGARHALAVNSCTAGLHLALAALGIGPGDEVITTPLTFCATVNTILEVGATPVLADIGADLNLHPAAMERAITPRTRAILPVHFAGLPCKMEEIWELAAAYEVKVIEDAAHAAGARYRGTPIGGGLSDAVAFSFYATKNMTTGEGGMVTCRNAELHERLKVLCLHGISHDAWNRYSAEGSWFYEVTGVGYKYNLTDIAASLGLEQLKKAHAFATVRRHIAQAYTAAFADLAEIRTPVCEPGKQHAWHLYVIQLDLDRLSVDRREFVEELRQHNIGASVHFIPLHLHPFYRDTFGYKPQDFANAAAAYQRIVSLPIYPNMTAADVDDVIAAVRHIVERHRR